MMTVDTPTYLTTTICACSFRSWDKQTCIYDRIIINSQSDLRKHPRDEYVFEKVIIMYAVTIYNTLTTKFIIISVSRVVNLKHA